MAMEASSKTAEVDTKGKTCRLVWLFSLSHGHHSIPSLSPQITTELFFLVAKFLEASPCLEAAKVDFSKLSLDGHSRTVFLQKAAQ